jgi:D-serine deaminase-like pyridoxal phosphate-dependent protein
VYASLIGRPHSDLDTPAYCVDLDALEANIEAMAEFIRARGRAWRPHVKCHKIPAIAHRQLRFPNTIGVTAAKLSEAEVFLLAGIADVLIANVIVGPQKLERLAGLLRHGTPIVVVDHFAQAEALSEACHRRGARCRVLIEINIGLNRIGVRPGVDTFELARGISKLQGIQIAGIMGYEGHLLAIPDADEKRTKIQAAMALLMEMHTAIEADGIPLPIVSAGGTGSYQVTSQCPGITELQAGGGIFGDPYYTERCGVVGLAPALRLIATVISRSKLERAVLDCGRKAIHPDIHPPRVIGTTSGRPLNDAVVTAVNAEHMVLELGPQSQDLKIGDKVEIIPGYADHTTPLHDRLFGIRQGRVEIVWPIAARGCIQ